MASIPAREARRTRLQELSLPIASLALIWGLAFFVMLNDIDFFSLQDLLDTSAPHHEHIVVALLLGGIVAAVISLIWNRRRREAG
jgi:cytochrome c-type biogenesis protein CcmE